MDYDIIIVGAGPAGLTAAIYALRAGKSVLIIEKQVFGGQITYSPSVENYPAFSKISGNEFADRLLNQVTELGAEISIGTVNEVLTDGDVRYVTTPERSYECRCVILATGSSHRTLGLENESALVGSGVSYCAVCDGAFFRNREVAVAGGGNTALQEALYLSDICSTVHLIHRRDEYRADRQLTERIDARKNIVQHKSYTITALHANENGALRALTLKSAKNGELAELKTDGLFVAVGTTPQNEAFSGLVAIDSAGYADVDEHCATNTQGVFVAGDCRAKSVRQLATAIADGAVAATAACEFIDSH